MDTRTSEDSMAYYDYLRNLAPHANIPEFNTWYAKRLEQSKNRNNMRAEDVRSRLNPAALVTGVADLMEQAKSLGEGATKENIALLRFQLDCHAMLLKKCLPDLKLIQLAGNGNLSSLTIRMDGSVGGQDLGTGTGPDPD